MQLHILWTLNSNFTISTVDFFSELKVVELFQYLYVLWLVHAEGALFVFKCSISYTCHIYKSAVQVSFNTVVPTMLAHIYAHAVIPWQTWS